MSLPSTVFPSGGLEIVGPRTPVLDAVSVARPRSHSKPSLPSRIAVIGNYLPRQCGIATFTTDLCAAISAEYGNARLLALPVNDTEQGYDYPARVRWSLAQDDVKSYQDAAEFLNFNNIDMVCLQHEYGIFGGPAGSYILHLLRGLKMPVVTTLHTVLRQPNPDQMMVMEEIAELSDRIIVMSQLSSQFLQEVFKVPSSKIDMVPHGVPDLPFLDPNFYKDRFGVEGKAVLLTFGLLSPNKGIENVIEALPQILSKHKNVVYIVAGATHPHILRREGDNYRAHLQALAKEVGVESNVIFHNRFASPEEMAEFIGAADIYITPYRHEAQVVSGTLAYALGAGKAIISTPYWHAIELLDDRRGALVPFQDPGAIAQKTIELLATPALRHAMRKRAYLFGRDMVWKKAAQGYMESFARVRSDRMETPRVQFLARAIKKSLNQLPELKLNHVNALTDDTGMLQHAIFTIPNRAEGYTTDDNARALIFTVLLDQLGSYRLGQAKSSNPDWAFRYLAFLEHAFDAEKKRFRNFLGYDHRWMEDQGSEDAHGRALWALGTLLARSANPGLRGAAGRLFEFSLPAVIEFYSPRAGAYALLGIQEYLNSYRVTGDNRWRNEAWSAFNWFLGDNDLQLPLYDSDTGGCRDGLHPERANQNQGAESTLSFLMALLEMQRCKNPKG